MDYEKKYKKALERARNLYKDAIDMGDSIRAKQCEIIFHELKESEDECVERIKKEIISYLNNRQITSIAESSAIEKWLTWLEKQGEQNPNNNQFTSEQADILDKHIDNFLGQKPAYKVEQKFKVGDWIVSNVSHEDYRICKILKIENGEYIIYSIYGYQGHNNFETFDKDYHLWTIQDAKDGDVLAFNNDTIVIFKDLYNSTTFHSYCHIEDGIFDFSKEKLPDWWEGEGFKPATKEQCDLLFQKMKEAGYTFDFEKKELKKINSYCQENCKGYQETGRCFVDGKCQAKKNAERSWSGKDEEMFDAVIADIRFTQKTHTHEVNQIVYEKEIDWLKSLKDRIQLQWKPSEEQLKALNTMNVTGCITEVGQGKSLVELYEQLKKLMEE